MLGCRLLFCDAVVLGCWGVVLLCCCVFFVVAMLWCGDVTCFVAVSCFLFCFDCLGCYGCFCPFAVFFVFSRWRMRVYIRARFHGWAAYPRPSDARMKSPFIWSHEYPYDEPWTFL